MKSFIVAIIIVGSFALLSFSLRNSEKNQYIPESEKVVNHLIGEAAKMLSQKYSMHPIGTGIGMPGGCVQFLGIDFQVTGPLRQEDLRKILLGSADDFLSLINADNAIKKYLYHYPFTLDDIGIELFIVDKGGRSLEHPHIGIASFRHEKIEYLTHVEIYDNTVKVSIPHDKEKYLETYEEAKKLAANSK